MKLVKRIISVFLALTVVVGGSALGSIPVKAAYDTTAPIIKSVSIVNSTVTKPGVLYLDIDLVEDETGVSDITVYAYSKNDNTRYVYGQVFVNSYNKLELYTGKHRVGLAIDSKAFSDEYHIDSISVSDSNGNTRNYYVISGYSDEQSYKDYSKLGESANESDPGAVNYGTDWNKIWYKNVFPVNNPFKVVDEFDVDFQYNITNPNLISKIKSMPKNGVGVINFTNEYWNSTAKSIASKAMFDAIRGTDKTLVFSANDIQWVFKGRDIINETKNIDLTTIIRIESGSYYGVSGDVLKVEFKDNGLLPGKARIRLKSDYIYNQRGLQNAIKLYYINDEENTLDYVDTNIDYILDATDHWCQFYVKHNSSYIATPKSVNNKTYTITYDANGGKGNMSTQKVKAYSNVIKFKPLENKYTKEGYRVGAWKVKRSSGNGFKYYSPEYEEYLNINYINVTESGGITLYAQWTPISYTLEFNSNGGKGKMSNQGIAYNNKIAISKNKFTKSGYTFVGWATSKANAKKLKVKYTNQQKIKNLSSKENQKIALYAVWVKNSKDYKLTYKLNGGNKVSNPTKYKVTSKTITLKKPTRKGYKFQGWYTKKSGGTKVIRITKGSYGNKTLYARWKKVK